MSAVPEGKVRMRRKAVAALSAHKQEGLHQLKDDPDEMLRGKLLPIVSCLPSVLWVSEVSCTSTMSGR